MKHKTASFQYVIWLVDTRPGDLFLAKGVRLLTREDGCASISDRSPKLLSIAIRTLGWPKVDNFYTSYIIPRYSARRSI